MRPDPPVELGADQEREMDALCGVATRFCGAVLVVSFTVTVIGEEVATLLFSSVVEARSVCDPFDVVSVSQA